MVLLPHLLNTPGVAGEDKHAQHIGQGGGNGHEARGVGDARPSHHGAASDNGGTHGGGQDHRPQCASRYIIVIRVLDALDEPHAHQQHEEQIQSNNDQI